MLDRGGRQVLFSYFGLGVVAAAVAAVIASCRPWCLLRDLAGACLLVGGVLLLLMVPGKGHFFVCRFSSSAYRCAVNNEIKMNGFYGFNVEAFFGVHLRHAADWFISYMG